MQNFLTLIFSILTLSVLGQPKPLSKTVGQLDFLTIEISHKVERYERNEVNVFYLENDHLKVHSILKTQWHAEADIDTSFVLSKKQHEILDAFGQSFDKDSFQYANGGVGNLAGAWIQYAITMKYERKTRENKYSDYSLSEALLKN